MSATVKYNQGQFQTYVAHQDFYVSLDSGRTSRKVKCGEVVHYDGVTVQFDDGQQHVCNEMRGAIRNGWLQPQGSDSEPVAPPSIRSIRPADRTDRDNIEKFVPELETYSVQDLGSVRNPAMEDLIQNLAKIADDMTPKPATVGRASFPVVEDVSAPKVVSKITVGEGPRTVRALDSLSPTTPESSSQTMGSKTIEVVSENRAVSLIKDVPTSRSLEDSAKATVTNPEAISKTAAASVSQPAMVDGHRPFKTSLKTKGVVTESGAKMEPLIEDGGSGPSGTLVTTAPQNIEEMMDKVRYETVRVFIPGFEWDKTRPVSERITGALKERNGPKIRGILAVEDPTVRSKIFDLLKS